MHITVRGWSGGPLVPKSPGGRPRGTCVVAQSRLGGPGPGPPPDGLPCRPVRAPTGARQHSQVPGRAGAWRQGTARGVRAGPPCLCAEACTEMRREGVYQYEAGQTPPSHAPPNHQPPRLGRSWSQILTASSTRARHRRPAAIRRPRSTRACFHEQLATSVSPRGRLIPAHARPADAACDPPWARHHGRARRARVSELPTRSRPPSLCADHGQSDRGGAARVD